MFVGQFDQEVAGVEPVPGTKPGLYGYGDGTYGYWMQEIQFGEIVYYRPDKPLDAVATIPGKHIAGKIIDWVFSKQHDGFKDHKMSGKPVGTSDGTNYYAELEVRERIRKGEPSDRPPFYGTFGAGNFTDDKNHIAAPGSQTKTGYVISANANMGDNKTPGCAPCLNLHLTPNVRSQFTALMSWGKLDYETSQRQFPGSGANASNEHDGNFSYTISVPVGKKKRAIEFKGPVLFDTGTAEFILVDADTTIKKLRDKGFKLAEYDEATVDIKFHGFPDKLNDLEYDDVIIRRLADEDDGDTVTIGLPFYQSNSVMYDLEHRITAYSPFYVTTGNFSTDAGDNSKENLGRVNDTIGSSGWIGLAGTLSGKGDFILEKGANVLMTNANTFTGVTHIADGSALHLSGPGSIEHSVRIQNEGLLHIEHKGPYHESWGVDRSLQDAVMRNINGSGDISLGANRLILTAASGKIDGSITDYDDNSKNMGGGVVLTGGKLIMAGENDYSGLTEIASGAELHVTGELTGDVSVDGRLVVDGQIYGKVKVNEGGQVSGTGTVGSVIVRPGGSATRMKTTAVD
ncbi:hypothetical protein [Brucella intermedia]